MRGKCLSLLRRADLLQPRIHEDARVKTNRGALMFIFSSIVTSILAFHSISSFLRTPTVSFLERMEVDNDLSAKMPLELNITFFHLSCADVELVALDMAGEVQLDIASTSLHKKRIASDGFPIGDVLVGQINRDKQQLVTKQIELPSCASCYGAEESPDDCCPTCQDVKQRYQRRGWDVRTIQREAQQCILEMDHPEIGIQQGEGCILQGTIQVNKVAGNVHVALGTTRKIGDQVVHTFGEEQLKNFDTSHHITTLRFGVPAYNEQALETGALDDQTRMVDFQLGQTAAIQYHLHLIPSRIYGTLTTYRYSVSERYFPVLEPEKTIVPIDEKHSTQHGPKKINRHFTLPGVYFMYDFSPFVVVRETIRVSSIDLITDILSLGGGVFAFVRLLDSALHLANL